MGLKPSTWNDRRLVIFLVVIGTILLTGCANGALSMGLLSSGTPSPSPVVLIQASPSPSSTATRTPFVPPTPTHTPNPTFTPIVTLTPTATPPASFDPKSLNTDVEAVPYILNECLYLADRWNPDNAAPGTVVLPVMFHGISPVGPRNAKDNITISTAYFNASMEKAYRLGFETITMQQLVDFLQHNAYIPPRSLLLIIDDRRLGTVKEQFMPVLKKYDWTLTMAYITGVINEQEWNQVREVLASGYTEIEAHGYLHNGDTYITQYTPEDVIRRELFAPITAFEEHLGYRPVAFIWPGGDFNSLSVELAREANYQVGFSAYARGPLLFNWIPQGEPERNIGDPLMLLPRYWSTTLSRNLDYVVTVSEQAAAQAEIQRTTELDWYSQNCKNYPPLVNPQPLQGE